MVRFIKRIFGYLFQSAESDQFVYPEEFVTLKVHSQGNIRWLNKEIYLSSNLAGEVVGLKDINGIDYQVYYKHIPIAVLNRIKMCLERFNTHGLRNLQG